MSAREGRRQALRRLGAEELDVLVIGGGINGAGIAREAALRGLTTALVDKGDFAAGTSSQSSKLIHGGFRYLETGAFGLVLAASRERDLLRRRLAPHLVTPLRFFFPVYRGGPLPLWKLRVGLALYDVLAAFRNIERHRVVRATAALEVEPRLRAEGLAGGALYYDCFTDDARLVLENVLGAEQAGAVCLNYVAVESLRKDGRKRIVGAEVRDLETGEGLIGVRARTVVNAAGPWLDRVRALDDPSAEPVLRPTKGVHLVLPRERVGNRHAVVLNAVADGRMLFVIPWEEHTIVGTTDTDFAGSPDSVAADEGDVRYLLETLNVYFPDSRLAERDVVSTFAGLRPLIAGALPEAPSKVSREEAIFTSASGLVSIGGGKLTTYRRVAIKVVDRVATILLERFGTRVLRRSGTDSLPLPGAVGESARAGGAFSRRYGSRAENLRRLVGAEPSLAAPLAAGVDTTRAEVAFAADPEHALRIEDALRRRTQVALRLPRRGVMVSEAAAEIMAERLDWDRATVERKVRAYVDESVPAEDLARRQA